MGLPNALYDGIIRTPSEWLGVARQLRAAGLLVFAHAESVLRRELSEMKRSADPDVGGPGLMLLGMALEDAFKAAIVRHESFAGTESGKMPDIKGHDLERLARRAQLLLSTEEVSFLREATDAVISSGRYPAPLRAADFRALALAFGRQRATFEGLWTRALSRAEEPREGGDVPP